MRRRIERTIGPDEAAFRQGLPRRVLDREVDPRLVEVALLGNMRVGYSLVLNHDIRDQSLAARDGKTRQAQRRDQGLARSGALLFERENVNVQHAFSIEAVLEKVLQPFGLLVVFV